ncbi:UpxY family transcription antiterminator [Spirosoma sp. KCTC 42546]|uniref:UpxY family transcription antiterminator n=1 Tax=Spirosoma sp. KCTC 42546 TaxID=2520506 RepID=UPI001156F02E|nr:UpxY family transcription antiterminator [Spirosoma sp. KCTC 42546]QDK78682.1 UpxY family transcription antiterminator [Spirosoma sp. KCTC 42546]
MPWFVIYTKSRSEKLAANELRKRGVDVYCPLRKIKRQWSDRVKMVEEPLFRSYCFVNLEENERQAVYGVPGVVGYLHWLQKPAIVKQKEIDLIKDMLNDFDHDALELLDFKTADRLKITSGAFMDQEGEVMSTQGKTIVVKLESLQVYVSVDLNKNKVEKVGRTKREL